MTNLIAGTEFEKQLRCSSHELTDEGFRRLVLAYCRLYQEDYWFIQLENAFAYLELGDCDPDENQTELASVRSEVEETMGEYFESLNEVAAAMYRLLDNTPFTVDDTIYCIAHVWNAYSCNEYLSAREKIEYCVACLRNLEPDNADKTNAVEEQSDGPKRWIGRFLMENLLATARSSVALFGKIWNDVTSFKLAVLVHSSPRAVRIVEVQIPNHKLRQISCLE